MCVWFPAPPCPARLPRRVRRPCKTAQTYQASLAGDTPHSFYSNSSLSHVMDTWDYKYGSYHYYFIQFAFMAPHEIGPGEDPWCATRPPDRRQAVAQRRLLAWRRCQSTVGRWHP